LSFLQTIRAVVESFTASTFRRPRRPRRPRRSCALSAATSTALAFEKALYISKRTPPHLNWKHVFDQFQLIRVGRAFSILAPRQKTDPLCALLNLRRRETIVAKAIAARRTPLPLLRHTQTLIPHTDCFLQLQYRSRASFLLPILASNCPATVTRRNQHLCPLPGQTVRTARLDKAGDAPRSRLLGHLRIPLHEQSPSRSSTFVHNDGTCPWRVAVFNIPQRTLGALDRMHENGSAQKLISRRSITVARTAQ
jgi:hypothetical protein